MRKTFGMLHRLAMCVLTLGGLVLAAGMLLAGDWRVAALCALGASLLALAVAHVPGKRRLAVSLPLAALLAAACAFAVDAAPVKRAAFGLMAAALFLLQVRECAAKAPVFERTVALCVGVALYLGAGIAAWGMGWADMNAPLYLSAAAFLALSALALNQESLESGYASGRARNPASAVLRANRLLVAVLLAVVAFVSQFQRIRDGASRVALALVRAVLRFVYWLMSLLPLSVSDGGSGGEMAEFVAEQAGEPHLIWQILYYVMLAVALVVAAFLVFLAVRNVVKWLRARIRRLMAYFRRFAEAVGEDYVDERTSLFDAAEFRRSVEAAAQRTLRRFAHREQRWAAMNPREKVRAIVRQLYRRANDADALGPLTLREAAARLGIAPDQQGPLADLYERARYSEEPVTDAEAEAMKGAIR